MAASGVLLLQRGLAFFVLFPSSFIVEFMGSAGGLLDLGGDGWMRDLGQVGGTHGRQGKD